MKSHNPPTCENLIAALKQRLDIEVAEHKRQVARARKKGREDREEAKQLECTRIAPRAEANQVKQAKDSGAWLTAVPSHKNGTILSKEEFSDNTLIRNGFEPLNIPQFCGGFGAEFTTEHGLNCKVGRHKLTGSVRVLQSAGVGTINVGY